MEPIVIGRNFVDSYLIRYACVDRENIDIFDLSYTRMSSSPVLIG